MKEISVNTYKEWRNEIILSIRRMRMKAVMQLNASNLSHYFSLGKEIIQKQGEQGWGTGVIKMLSEDLTREFGNDSGYSERNLRSMKRFAESYPDFPFWQVPLAKIRDKSIWQATLAKLPQASANMPALLEKAGEQFMQLPLAQITWYHHISLLSKNLSDDERAFYIIKTAQEGWSRDIMLLQVDSDLYHRQGIAINNFHTTLPAPDSDLVVQMFKDPYNLGFVDMSTVKRETDFEKQLVRRITEFLTEMGHGFAYVGHQVHLDPEDDEAIIDLLMYHLKQHRYVGIELKTTEFKPEYVSKLNYYVSLIDDFIKTPEDNPSIGLLLCRTKSEKKVRYTLRGMTQPLGVSEYETQRIADSIRSSIPTIEEIENETETSTKDNSELSDNSTK